MAGLSRREFLRRGAVAASAVALPLRAQAASDFQLLIGPCTVELAPKRWVRTVGYNGVAPGLMLRLKEGRLVTIQVTNRTGNEEIVHWHGLHLPPEIDGAMEEGTPMIAPGATQRYTFVPDPSGLRWYHTHTFAGKDRKKGQYSAQHGLMYVEPRENPGRYDAEFFLALEDWEPYLMQDDDAAMNPSYRYSSINGRIFGFGEPLRVKQGDRAVFHIVNTSATEFHWIAFAGHQFQVIALDGNPVARPATVSQLRLAPAERVSAVVEMKNPGRWALAEIRRHIRDAGMGITVEYAGSSGAPAWQQPTSLQWSYLPFAAESRPPERTVIPIPMVFRPVFQGHGSEESWTINGKSFPDVVLPLLKAGAWHRLQMRNDSMEDHSIHLHRHTFELRTVKGKSMQGVMKDTVVVEMGDTVEVDLLASNPGASLLHCHQQNHMDRGFMALFRYA